MYLLRALPSRLRTRGGLAREAAGNRGPARRVAPAVARESAVTEPAAGAEEAAAVARVATWAEGRSRRSRCRLGTRCRRFQHHRPGKHRRHARRSCGPLTRIRRCPRTTWQAVATLAWEAAAETEGAAFAAALAPTMEGKAGGASSPGAGASNRWPAFWPCFAAEKKGPSCFGRSAARGRGTA